MTTSTVIPESTLREAAAERWGADEILDLTIGNPMRPLPALAQHALGESEHANRYPPAAGTDELCAAIESWIEWNGWPTSPGVGVSAGTKEFIGWAPLLLQQRDPRRRYVLFPELSYPTYRTATQFPDLLPFHVASNHDGRMQLGAIPPDVVRDAVCLIVNSPQNPTGTIQDLGRVAEWGRENGVPIISDECYGHFSWHAQPRTITQYGHNGVIAVHSPSKLFSAAGLRVGFYVGDPELVDYLTKQRRSLGLQASHPSQAALTVLLNDCRDEVDRCVSAYRSQLRWLIRMLQDRAGVHAAMPIGGIYLWVRAPDGNGNNLASQLATNHGILVNPGLAYGDAGAAFVRLAAMHSVQYMEELMDERT